jgi:hypothetical protein
MTGTIVSKERFSHRQISIRRQEETPPGFSKLTLMYTVWPPGGGVFLPSHNKIYDTHTLLCLLYSVLMEKHRDWPKKKSKKGFNVRISGDKSTLRVLLDFVCS